MSSYRKGRRRSRVGGNEEDDFSVMSINYNDEEALKFVNRRFIKVILERCEVPSQRTSSVITIDESKDETRTMVSSPSSSPPSKDEPRVMQEDSVPCDPDSTRMDLSNSPGSSMVGNAADDCEAEPMALGKCSTGVSTEVDQNNVHPDSVTSSAAEPVVVNGFHSESAESALDSESRNGFQFKEPARIERDRLSLPQEISRVLSVKNYRGHCSSYFASKPENRTEARLQKVACSSNQVNTNNGPKPLCRDCIEPDVDGDAEMRCRFKHFRVFLNDGSVDFLDPRYDVDDNSMKLWLPVLSPYTRKPREDAARLILTHATDTFCRVVQEERAVLEAFEGIPSDVRVRDGVVFKHLLDAGRETCDVCETTIFNYHWVCPACGFAVCIDCWSEAGSGNQTRPWDPCVTGTSPEEVTKLEHDRLKFLLVQNIPGSILYDVSKAMHFGRRHLKIDGNCGCDVQKDLGESASMEVVELNVAEKIRAEEKERRRRRKRRLDKDLLKASKLFEGKPISLKRKVENDSSHSGRKQMCTAKCAHPIQGSMRVAEEWEAVRSGRKACSFLCNGDLLRVESAAHGEEQCMVMFQREWRVGQPVLVVGVDRKLKVDLWRPEAFNKNFGHHENELINSLTGRTLAPRPMKVFWDGFADYKERMLDSCHRPMLLKLKDWPPGEDFKEIGKKWFDDVMTAFPVSDYTSREGHLNLAWYLPEKFIPPDLGPKMYVAYGSAIHPSISSTNLHLDVSDAANVMAYVGACSVQEADAWRALDAAVTAGCDISVLEDIRRGGRQPGALWHIYDSKDSPKIRDLLMRVRREQNLPLGSHSDPIHDQQTYLDETLRNRLREDYGVVGYSFIQCYGDAVFIPAGAPHQVRNLMNCIKVAEDFVSAETVSHCYSLMKDFRRLSDNHTNHEDKLQIKNMVYHAIKSAMYSLFKPPAITGRRGRPPLHRPCAPE